jgi:acyl dehydratase
VECKVLQARPTSRGRGLVRTRNRIVTQRNETVIEYTPLRMMAGRFDASRT